MNIPGFVDPDEIRAQFSRAMSEMYKDEVPLYGTLMELVAETNQKVLESNKAVSDYLKRTGEIERLDMERHGAIRVAVALPIERICTCQKVNCPPIHTTPFDSGDNHE